MGAVENIVNESLRELGYRRRIGDIYEGSEAAKAALEVYGQTRDELLRSQDWPFARRSNFSLQLLRGPPPPGGYNPAQPWSNIFASPGFLFEYAYPGDALEIRAIVRPPGLWPDRDPRPALFSIVNDATLGLGPNSQVLLLNTGDPLLLNDGEVILLNTQPPPSGSVSGLRVILTNVFNALSTYKARVVDPSTWDVLFTATLIKLLAKKLSIALRSDLNLMQAEEKGVDPIANLADRHRG